MAEPWRVLVVEDGPTLTHGGMKIGAGIVAAQKYGAAEVIDPRPHAVGSIKTTFKKYLGVMHHQADIPVLASALEVEPNMILSDNREHFNDRVAERCGIRIYSAEEFLNSLITGAIREQLGLEK